MKNQSWMSAVFLGLVLLSLNACKDDPEPVNESELITTLTINLTPQGGGIPKTFSFRDLDGDGGNAPIITSDVLSPNTVYNATLAVLDESKAVAENITEEVEEEGAEHQFFYVVTGANLTVAYKDTDSNGKPVGIETTFSTGAAGNGTMKVILRHEPDKNASGVSAGDPANAGGETDIEVTFDIKVQ